MLIRGLQRINKNFSRNFILIAIVIIIFIIYYQDSQLNAVTKLISSNLNDETDEITRESVKSLTKINEKNKSQPILSKNTEKTLKPFTDEDREKLRLIM
jgi:hypothetical protein